MSVPMEYITVIAKRNKDVGKITSIRGYTCVSLGNSLIYSISDSIDSKFL